MRMREAGPGQPAIPELPLVSVVIVVRNEAPRIRDCLQRVVAQNYPHHRMEILVVDGESVDGTDKIVEAFDTRGIPLRLLRNREKGRAAGLNVGISAAWGDVIARVDGRTLIEPDYLSRCVRVLKEFGADNVGGVQRPLPATPMQQAIGMAMTHRFGIGDAQFRLGGRSGPVDTVYLGCFRREVFQRVGLFNTVSPAISEDSELNFRIRKSGGRVYLDTGIVAYYRPRETLRELWELYFDYGGLRAGSVIMHRSLQTGVRPLAPVALVGALVTLGLAGVLVPASRVGFGVVAGAYLAAGLIVSGTLAWPQRSLPLFARLATVFPSMHLAFGLGFWKRLLTAIPSATPWKNFRRLWRYSRNQEYKL